MLNTLGTRLRSARERKHMSQIDVFKRAGINNKTLSRYENNGTEPDADALRKLAELYEVSVDWLLGRDKKESDYALPESEYDRIIKEAEHELGVKLRDDPDVEGAVRELIWRLARMKKK